MQVYVIQCISANDIRRENEGIHGLKAGHMGGFPVKYKTEFGSLRIPSTAVSRRERVFPTIMHIHRI